MGIGFRLAVASCIFVLGGCAHVSRDGATALSQAGVQATTSLAADVDARVSRLRADRAAQDFVAAYNIMAKCPSVTHGTANDPNCDSAVFADGRRKNALNMQIGMLAGVVAKRSLALKALGSAYSALGDEAAYDAPGSLDTAIAPALDAVNQFGAAVGLGAAPALVGGGVKLLGHAVAADAQRRRLVWGSRQIAQLTQHMRLALQRERDLFGALDDLLGSLDAETRRTILKAGLLDPSATVKSIATGAGLTLADAKLSAALGADQALRAAAEVATLDTLSSVSSGDLDAGIALLTDLEAQHVKFEQGEPPNTARIAADVQKLSEIVSAAKK